MAQFQTTVTALIANRQVSDGIDAQIQVPDLCKEEEGYLKAAVQASYEQMEQARTRLLELLHHMKHRLAYKKRTEIVVEMVKQLEAEGNFPLEAEGNFPQADYAFDNGVLTVTFCRPALTVFTVRQTARGVAQLQLVNPLCDQLSAAAGIVRDTRVPWLP